MSTKKGKGDCSCSNDNKVKDYNNITNELGKRALKALGAGSGAILFANFLSYFFNKAGEMFNWMRAKNEALRVFLGKLNVKLE